MKKNNFWFVKSTFRYAHTSILQHTSAVMNNYLLGVNGIVIPSAILMSSILINFTFRILNKINIKIQYRIIFSIIYSNIYFLKLIDIPNMETTPSTSIIFLFNFNSYKKKFLNTDEILKILILTLFIIQNKIILAFSVFFILIYLNKEFISNFWKKKILFFNIIF